MPINNENPITPASGTLYMKNPDTGEDVCLGQCGPITDTIEADPADPIAVGQINLPKEATFTIAIKIRKMSRKRFVKKLMGAMVPRNVANSMADIVLLHGDSYGFGYFVINCSGYLPWEA